MDENISNFREALLGHPPCCLGLQLRPYSLGHEIVLRHLDSSFLRGELGLTDLFIGVLVCSRTFEEWAAMSRWRSLKLFLRLWGWFLSARTVERGLEQFEAYIEAGRRVPDQNIRQKGAALSCPWENRLKVILMRHLHLTETEVLNRPLALSHWDYCTIGELDGNVSMFSEGDDAFISYHRRRILEEKAKEN